MFAKPDKEKLGNRYVCYECGTKFYDLTKPEPLCPECDADQRNAPVRDLKALLGSGKGRKPTESDDDDMRGIDDDGDDDDDDDDDLAGDFDDADDDGDMDEDDDE